MRSLPKPTGEAEEGIPPPISHPMASRFERINRKLAEILYGMAIHDQVRTLAKQRGSLEHLFVLISFGDLLGVPILPPYYSLRLLPFIVPEINNWKRRMLREKDLMDAIF
jgi:hypothetical protein